MILVGQFDSPFVRRVAIALHHYGLPFERQVLSVFNDFDAMRAINPLGKVPALILDDGEVLFDSGAILDYLDGIAPADRKLAPMTEPARRRVLRTEVMAIGLAEKTHARNVEINRRAAATRDADWLNRLETQITSVLAWLEARAPSPWFHGDRFSRADLAVVVAFQYVSRAAPLLADPQAYPNLAAHRRRCEDLPAVAAVPDSPDGG